MPFSQFYSHHIESRKFARLVAVISADWEREKQFDFVNTLLIGESAKATARFIVYYTEGNTFGVDYEDNVKLRPWSPLETKDLVRAAAVVLRWTENFMVGRRSWMIKKKKKKKKSPKKTKTHFRQTYNLIRVTS
jgi:hypothetical protein